MPPLFTVYVQPRPHEEEERDLFCPTFRSSALMMPDWMMGERAAVPLFLDGQTDTMGNNEALRRKSAQNAGHI